ncbi:MAG TPA: hypothetical protein VHU20_09585 [Candidatus Eisenbacteria bacterium]|nr:hypothetical protein [Candidatus Eisenbacteria bacterium]
MSDASRRRSTWWIGTGWALALVLGSAEPARAGAWLREPGEAYAKGSVARLTGDEVFDAEGERRPLDDAASYADPKYREVNASLYTEYGAARWLTLIASVPLKLAEHEADAIVPLGDIEGSSFGLGDLHVGARLPLHRGPWLAAVEPDLKIPLYGSPDPVSDDPELGSGFVDLGAAAVLGAGVPRVRGYAQASLGYRLRGGSTSEELYWDAEIGVEPWQAVRARIRYDGVDSQGAGSGVSAAGTPVPSAGEQDHHRIAPTLALGWAGSTEISVTWRRVIAGRSTLASDEWEVALSFLGRVLPVASGGR